MQLNAHVNTRIRIYSHTQESNGKHTHTQVCAHTRVRQHEYMNAHTYASMHTRIHVILKPLTTHTDTRRHTQVMLAYLLTRTYIGPPLCCRTHTPAQKECTAPHFCTLMLAHTRAHTTCGTPALMLTHKGTRTIYRGTTHAHMRMHTHPTSHSRTRTRIFQDATPCIRVSKHIHILSPASRLIQKAGTKPSNCHQSLSLTKWSTYPGTNTYSDSCNLLAHARTRAHALTSPCCPRTLASLPPNILQKEHSTCQYAPFDASAHLRCVRHVVSQHSACDSGAYDGLPSLLLHACVSTASNSTTSAKCVIPLAT